MNDINQMVWLCFTLALVMVFWHRGWKQYHLDRLRENLFALRGQLFDQVFEKQVALNFGDPAYVVLRQFFNRSLRYCHRLTFVRLSIGIGLGSLPVCKNRIDLRSYKSRVERELDQLEDENLKGQLRSLYERAMWHQVMFLILTSPTGLLLMLVTILTASITVLVKTGITNLGKAIWATMQSRMETPIRAISREAEELEENEGLVSACA